MRPLDRSDGVRLLYFMIFIAAVVMVALLVLLLA